ncbi:MAG: J domain-containing protein [SAR324 cluster bacterium]|nr:J domain-containing protein [SAR324 cluster bacterium]
MQFRFFVGYESADDLKARFRELSKRLHPDLGGSQSDFVAMVEEFRRIQNMG